MNSHSTQKNLKVAIYGMQSSGASLFTYFLSQIPRSLAIIDLWTDEIAPRLVQDLPVIIKSTVSSKVGFDDTFAEFSPHICILFLRDPIDNYLSLSSKTYKNEGGTPEEQLRTLEEIFRQRRTLFSEVILYEEFTGDITKTATKLKTLGLALPRDASSFRRSINAIIDYNIHRSTWCRRNFNRKWNTGNIHLDSIGDLQPIRYRNTDQNIRSLVSDLAPCLTEFFRNI